MTNPQEIGSDAYHDLIWDLQDGCTLLEQVASANNALVDLLSKNGLQSLLTNKEVIERINFYRKQRSKALEFAQNLKATPLTIIRNPAGRNIQDTIINWLLRNGAKVAIAIKEDGALNQCSISFRQSKQNTPVEIEKYRLDILAQSMPKMGGGHKEASGAAANTFQEAIEHISVWAKDKNLELSIIDASRLD